MHLLLLVLFCGVCLASEDRRVDQVIVVFKTHFDIGYTDMASNVVRRYRTTMIDQALEVVDQNRNLPPEQQFVWTLPGWPMSKILENWDGQTPARQERVRQAFQQGRFAVHALPFTTHTELLEAEDPVRGMGFASRLARSAGLPLPRDAKMTDVPCHSWFVPTLLKQAGVDFLHLGCNAASSSPQVPILFWWEGPDGARLLTMYSAESYGTGLVPPRNWPYRTWLALIHTGDNHGPPTPEEVRKLLEQAREQLPEVKVRIGRLSDFADAILAEKAELPVIRGDMPDTWIHGPMSDPAGARIARNVRPAIAGAESLHTQLTAWGLPVPEAAPAIARAYENSLLYGEHTWGGALYWVSQYSASKRLPYGEDWKAQRAQGHYDRLESSWAEHTAYIEAARDLIGPIWTNDLGALARAVRIEGPRVVVYNPLPWKRDGVVDLPAGSRAIEALKPSDGTGAVPVEAQGGSWRFLARDVPAMGYRTYVQAKGMTGGSGSDLDASASGIENRFFKVGLDSARGVIRSLIDKRTGRELADVRSAHGLGQYLYERFDSDHVQAFVKAYVKISADWATNELGKPNMPPTAEVPYAATSPNGFKMRIERTPVSVAAIMEAPGGAGVTPAVTTRAVLYSDQPCLDLEMTLHEKPADPWPEAGWICLPFKVDSPRFRLGRLGSIIDPARDTVRGCNQYLFGLNSGLTITDAAGDGVGVCPLDSPLVSLGSPGCWRYSRQFEPRPPAVYVNLFNNQWTTNFRLWNQGTWTWRVRLWAIHRGETDTALVVPSAEARAPLMAGWCDGAAGSLPAIQRGLEVSARGVLVTAFGPNPDGLGTVLRLWENAGHGGDCQVQLPAGFEAKTVQPVNLRGQPLGRPLAVKDGRFRFTRRPFAPFSCLIGAN